MLKKFNFFFLVLFFSSVMNIAAMPGAPSSETLLKGKVLETMNSGGYTYMKIADSNKKTQWVAIPETKVKQGDIVEYHNGMIMKDFTSNTLKRSFNTIIFSSGLAGNNAQLPHDSFHSQKKSPQQKDDSFASAVQAEQKEPQTPAMGQSSGGSSEAIVPFTEIHVEKVTGPNGYTVGELFEKAKDLNGKKIKVRGKVLKFSPMIMGRNWIHIQDGTGDTMKNHHDLVVTSTEEVQAGSQVVVEGILAADKDFGAGYTYDVIIENATLTEEK